MDKMQFKTGNAHKPSRKYSLKPQVPLGRDKEGPVSFQSFNLIIICHLS